MPRFQRLTAEYRLLRRLGQGGMGEVWEAARLKGDGIVVSCAIKLLHAEFTETARERKLFGDEARIAAQLDHSRIVKIIDIGTARDGRPFLVMERVDGVDLRGFVEAAKAEGQSLLDLNIVVHIVGEVLSALDYAHERKIGNAEGGVVHSDVTPGNILISSSGEVKLTDFGIARLMATAGPMSRAVGTPRYMSPEQLSGDPQRATDIYGLGVVLHELLEGRRFLDGLTPDAFRSRVLMGPPPRLTREGVPAWLDELRGRMIATRPQDRPSANEAWELMLRHCPGYAAAAARLRHDYARLIGGRRSGVTLLQLEDADDGSDEVEPTQLLPATEPEPEPESVRTITGAPAPQPTIWLAVASGALALAMGLIGMVQLVKMLREPTEDVPVEVADAEPEVDPGAKAERAVALPEANPVPPPPPKLEFEPAPEPDPAVHAEPALETEPSSPPKAKPKPAAAKVGVIFVVEKSPEGQLRIGRKIMPIKNRSVYVELLPGKYALSVQPSGTNEWHNHGHVKIADISPKRYQVRLDDGTITGVDQL